MKILEKLEIPKDTVNDEEVKIKNIYISDDTKISEKTILLDYETSKANFELESNFAGFATILCKEEDVVKIGQTVVIITDQKGYKDNKSTKKSKKITNLTFSKKAQEKVDELKIDKEVFNGKEFVTEKMVLDYVNKNQIDKTSIIKKTIPITLGKMAEIKNLTNMNRVGLVSVVSKSFESINIDSDTVYSKKEFKGSLSPLIAKVVSDLLSTDDYSHLNSYVDDSKIYLNEEVNFGVAINLGSGLKIGVINNSNSISIEDIENRMLYLIDKYIDDKMDLDDMKGATVVLTDLTDQGIDDFQPLIINNNTLMIGLAGKRKGLQKLIIAFDHRVTDGLEISKFMNEIINNLISKFPNFDKITNCYKCLKSLEQDEKLGTSGFFKVLTHDNNHRYVCVSCVEGY